MVAILFRYRRRLLGSLRAFDERRFAARERPAPDVTWITEDLAIGGRIKVEEWEPLARAGIGAVVDCRAEACDPADHLARLGIAFLHLPTPDATSFTPEQVVAGVSWVEQQLAAGRRVLVHCKSGKGRSVLLGAAVLGRRGLGPNEALARIRSRRPWITPTPGQIRRLRAFANTHR